MKTLRNVVCAVVVVGLLSLAGVAWGQVHALAWGEGYSGQLGNGTFTNSGLPVQVMNLSGVVKVVGGYWHSLAVKDDGTAWAWGNNQFGELGDGTFTDRSLPVRVKDLSGVVAVGGSVWHSLALKSDGTVWVWGRNDGGQLGDGTFTNSNVPTQVPTLSGVIAVGGGLYHSFALKSDGTVWAWGDNAVGQLGDGTFTDSSVPVQVKNLYGVVAVTGGARCCLALKSDGTVWAWGGGALGNANITTSNLPLQVQNLSGVVAVSGGSGHVLALKNDGTVWAWGINSSGQLGDGTTPNAQSKSLLPLQVKNLAGAIAVSAGGSHSLAVKENGTVWAWGNNNYDQLGYDTPSYWSSLPGQVRGLSGVSAISAGGGHSLAVVESRASILTLSTAAGLVGNAATLDATLQDAVTGAKVAGRTVLFKVDGADVGRANTSINGVARFSFAVKEGTTTGVHPTGASFAGDPFYISASANSTLTVSRGSTLTLPTVTAQIGKNATLTAALKDTITGAALRGRTVRFKIDGADVGTVITDADGMAHYAFEVAEGTTVGSHPTAASFDGDQDYAPTSASSTLAISKGKFSLTLGAATGQIGREATLHATLKDPLNGATLAGQSVLFKIDGVVVGTVITDSNGVAKCLFLVPEGFAVGSHPTAATFAGDQDYAPASASSTLTISKGRVTLSVPNAAGYPGQTVTFSAVLKTNLGVVLAGRFISFTLDGNPIGSAATDSTGKAKLSYTIPAGTSLGTHALTASFAGDGNYEAITKSATLTVNKIPTKLPVYPNSGVAGSTVNLCARLLDAFGVPMAGATLSYSMSGVALGTAVTDGTGQAKFPYVIPAGTAAGIYTFTVSYAGDATHLGRSNVGNLTVK